MLVEFVRILRSIYLLGLEAVVVSLELGLCWGLVLSHFCLSFVAGVLCLPQLKYFLPRYFVGWVCYFYFTVLLIVLVSIAVVFLFVVVLDVVVLPL